jgi:succinate dehydrogenase / fumarate reductase flavoprotein subunit
MCGSRSSFGPRIWRLLDNRSFGGTQVQRTFYAAGQTGQQLLLGAYSALERQIGMGKVEMFTRHEMLEIVKLMAKHVELLPVTC